MIVRNNKNDCEKATFLIEQQQFAVLSIFDSKSLQDHLLQCSECTIYRKQSELITSLCRKILPGPLVKILLDDTFKKGLQSKINQKLFKL